MGNYEDQPFRINDYPGLYKNAEELLLMEGIPCNLPGFAFLRFSAVLINVYGKVEKAGMLNLVIKACSKLVIPHRDDKDNKMEDSLAWMVDALIFIGEIDENDVEVEEQLLAYINEIARKI